MKDVVLNGLTTNLKVAKVAKLREVMALTKLRQDKFDDIIKAFAVATPNALRKDSEHSKSQPTQPMID
jgi:hypothetical protein